MTEGKKIWVESIMTPEEWHQRYKSGLGSSTAPWPPQEFECEMKWRKGMGANVTFQEMTNANKNLDYLLKKVKK